MNTFISSSGEKNKDKDIDIYAYAYENACEGIIHLQNVIVSTASKSGESESGRVTQRGLKNEREKVSVTEAGGGEKESFQAT